MNETIKQQETVSQGWVKRMATALYEKLFAWLCQCEMGLSPYESQLFMFHSGLGCEEAASYYYLANTKQYEEQI